jgi:hypothetical protein
MAVGIEALLVRAIAPAHLADAIVGDLCERRLTLAQTLGEARAMAVCRADALRSLPSLATYSASRSLAENWMVALITSAVICALCVAAIPLWDHIGLGSMGYHVLRLALIGLILGCIPRASTLSCAFLLLMIGVTDCVIDARDLGIGWRALSEAHLYFGLFVDGVAMASTLTALRLVKLIRLVSR